MKIKRKKCATGTSIKGLVQNPSEVLAQNNLNLDKAMAEAQTSPFSQFMSYMIAASSTIGQEFTQNVLPLIKKMAFGGKVEQVPVEVEGEEVAQTPDGSVMEFNGPSHEEGGIPTSLPEETKIYSKRIKKFGNTMAERAKKRAKKEARLESKLAKNPGDILIAQTLDRIKAINKKAEEQDLALQEAFNNLFNPQEQTAAYSTSSKGLKKYFGGTNSLGVLKPEDEDYTGMYLNKSLIAQHNDPYNILNVVNPVSTLSTYNRTIIPDREDIGTEIVGIGTFPTTSFDYSNNQNYNMVEENLTSKNTSGLQPTSTMNTKPNIVQPTQYSSLKKFTGRPAEGGSFKYTPGMTYGDVVGLTGQAISTIAPYMNTLKNRASDRLNENFMQGVGDEALKTYEDAVVSLKQNRDKALQDLELMRNTMAQRARNSARGINTSRALDLFSQQELNKKQNEINMAYANQLMEVMMGKAGMQLQTDQLQRDGAQTADTMNRQDQDAFNQNLGRDKANIGFGLQNMGKSMNQIYANKDLQNKIAKLKAQGVSNEDIKALIELELLALKKMEGLAQPAAEQPK